MIINQVVGILMEVDTKKIIRIDKGANFEDEDLAKIALSKVKKIFESDDIITPTGFQKYKYELKLVSRYT